MKEIIKTIIKDFHLKGIEDYKKRDIKIPLNTNKIITLIGPRRSGKTFLFYQIIEELKIPIENIIYINFEDERLEISKEDLNIILESYLEMFPNKKFKNLFFFFDEIQNVDGWEKFVRRVYDTISKNIFITGSSAKLLSKEIATSLRGRTLTFEVYPLSFKEFLKFKEIDYKDIISTKNKAKIKFEFLNYLNDGGFPETINFEDNIRLKTLQNYSEVMLYRDLIERYNLINIVSLKYFIKKVASNISKEFSINKVFNIFKSQKINISKDMLYLYPNYFEDAFFLFFLKRYSFSISLQEFSSKKAYIIDTGLANAISFKFSEDKGRILENLVFIELKRRGKEIYYHREKKECDFVIKEKNKIVGAIQVCKKLENGDLGFETKKREIFGLVEAMRIYNLKEGLILTEDEEFEIENGEWGLDTCDKNSLIKIKVMPIWKWLLNETQ